MSYWTSPQRAPVNRRHPKSQAICDQCGMLYHHDALSWQYEWRGNQLMNTRFLVCRPCLDKPFELNRPIRLPPDPVPIKDPRPSWFDNTLPSTNAATLDSTVNSSNNITLSEFFKE